MNDTKHYKAIATGRHSKAAGRYWEKIIESACRYYRDIGKAEISKTPEPMKPIKSLGGGKFIAYYEKMAQPDFKGTLYGGKSVVFEAKHTDSDRLQQSVISSEQKKQLDRNAALGAECFVMVSFRFKDFFKIPWDVFKDMKRLYGRKYITPQDVQPYKIKYVAGILQIF